MWILLGQHLRKIGLLFTPTTGRTESVSLSTSSHNQCDQIGRFLEFIAKKIVTKVAQMFGDFLGNSENHCFLCQTDRATFGKTWATFYFTIWSHCSQPTSHSMPLQETHHRHHTKSHQKSI